MGRSAKVSILMLTYNAPEYVDITIRSVVAHTKNIDYELVVVDNASGEETRELVQRLHQEGLIHTLRLMDYNSLFAEGNNIAARAASPDATHFLLLNSDVRVQSPDWLEHLLSIHKPGVTAYGVVERPTRVDGYCYLIDAPLYREYNLDEGHQWWWAVTKQQAILLNKGYCVQGYVEHEKYLHHFGGASGNGYKSARGMNVTRQEVHEWFAGRAPFLIDYPEGRPSKSSLRLRIRRILSRLLKR